MDILPENLQTELSVLDQILQALYREAIVIKPADFSHCLKSGLELSCLCTNAAPRFYGEWEAKKVNLVFLTDVSTASDFLVIFSDKGCYVIEGHQSPALGRVLSKIGKEMFKYAFREMSKRRQKQSEKIQLLKGREKKFLSSLLFNLSPEI
ncbi:MAG: hypothetical protein KAR00_01460 [Candidatus Pacebacteria bacterium]|nr:hypothetical protein [Candidatus Paceibacterota bacterium]